LTFFLYLSDVEAGGGTDFPELGITVMPKKGRAVLWPSVYNAEPMNVDYRTEHQALPVFDGLKFGANAWVHMYVRTFHDDCSF
jgi:prolyl 4-hydroxylase